MTDKASDIAALGGSRPSETAPGASGGGPTGGGLAVPTDTTLMDKGGTLGDTGSLDDAGLNSGTSLAEEGETAMPQANPDTAGESSEGGVVPTGGLSETGTVGGSPTGTSSGRMGGVGRLSDGGGLTE